MESLGWVGYYMVHKSVHWDPIINGKNIPDVWSKCIMVPIYKNKRDIQGFTNCRVIKLMSINMKLREGVFSIR